MFECATVTLVAAWMAVGVMVEEAVELVVVEGTVVEKAEVVR